jgi:hypothetical protein
MAPRVVIDFVQVRLQATADAVPALADFYADFRPGPEFAPAEGKPFYHFAFLVPGDRFEAAFAWARGRYELYPRQDGELVFDFSFWDALACYFSDPAGNIVELIAHRGLGESGRTGPFSPGELLGISEVGLVGDVPAMACDLEGIGLRVWSGTADDPGSLAFVGEKARTLILCPVGRGWLPTDVRAEPHPVEAVLSGGRAGEVVTGQHRIRVF